MIPVAIDTNNNPWFAVSGGAEHCCLVKMVNDSMVNYSNAEFGFTPYYFGDIEIDRQNKICCAIDYLLSSGRYGPQLMIFNGESAEQLQYDSVSIVSSITVDDQDTIRCFGMGGNYAVYDGEEWSVNDSSFIEKGIFAIEQAPDGKMWVGTGDGIYISD